jgi:hypothetical protein
MTQAQISREDILALLPTVSATIADHVAEAMAFMGSIVDDRRDLPEGRVRLFSEGYWAHGF